MNQSLNIMQYKYLTFFAMLGITFFIIHLIFMNKLIALSSGILSAGSIIIPFNGMLEDIFTEVYGFKISVYVYWLESLCIVIFSVMIMFIARLSSPIYWHEHVNFNYVFNHSQLYVSYAVFLSIFSYRVNAYLLIKWKTLLKGKYFWIRSVTSTMISELVFLALMTPTWVIYGPATNIKEAINLTLASLAFRLIFYVILSFPSTFIVNALKVIEQVDIYETHINFNPFAKSISIKETQI